MVLPQGTSFAVQAFSNMKRCLGDAIIESMHMRLQDGLREGEGTFKYPNGDIYSGMWKASACLLY
eukprot:4359698-Amphidinium_carterae.1